MMDKKIFDIEVNRLRKELCRIVVGQKRTMLLRLTVVAVVVFLGAGAIQYSAIKAIQAMIAYKELHHFENIPEHLDLSMMIEVPRSQAALFCALMFIFGCIAASMMFDGLGSKEKRINMLMRPVSMQEKMLAQWIVYVPCFLVLFLMVTVVTDLLRPLVLWIVASRNDEITLYNSWYYITQHKPGEIVSFIYRIMSMYAFVISLFTLGATIWYRNTLLKTISVLAGIGLAGVMWYVFWLETYSSDFDFFACRVLPWAPPVLYTLAIVNWIIAYRRLTETDVIDHVGPYN